MKNNNVQDHVDIDYLLVQLMEIWTTMPPSRDDFQTMAYNKAFLFGCISGIATTVPSILPRRKQEILMIVDILDTCLSILDYHMQVCVRQMDTPEIIIPRSH